MKFKLFPTLATSTVLVLCAVGLVSCTRLYAGLAAANPPAPASCEVSYGNGVYTVSGNDCKKRSEEAIALFIGDHPDLEITSASVTYRGGRSLLITKRKQ